MRLVGRISDSDVKWARDIGTAWYRSKESVPTHPHFVGDGYLSNKKWPLIEESTFFPLHLQNGIHSGEAQYVAIWPS